MTKKKLLTIKHGVIEALTTEAAKQKTLFKPFAEQILENYAKPFIVLKKQKEARAKK